MAYSVNKFKVNVGVTRPLSLNILNPMSTLKKVNARVLSALESHLRVEMGYVAQTIHNVRANLVECNDASSYVLHSKRLLDFLTEQKQFAGRNLNLEEVVKTKDAIISASNAHAAVTRCQRALEMVPSDVGSCDTTLDQIDDYVSDLVGTIEPFKNSLLELNYGSMLLIGLLARLMDSEEFSELGFDTHGKLWLDKTLHEALWKDYTANNYVWQPYYGETLSIIATYRTGLTFRHGDSTVLWNAHRFLVRAHRYRFSRSVVPKILDGAKLPCEVVEIIMDRVCGFHQVLQTKILLEIGCSCQWDEECGDCGHYNRNLKPWDDTI